MGLCMDVTHRFVAIILAGAHGNLVGAWTYRSRLQESMSLLKNIQLQYTGLFRISFLGV